MPSRRAFLKKAAVAAAAISTSAVAATQLAKAAQPSPAPASSPAEKAKPPIPAVAPKPSPAASPPPSKLARELAASLQRDLPKAHISESMTEKIASDINDNFAINKAFRNRKKRELPPPDFMFTAAESDQT